MPWTKEQKRLYNAAYHEANKAHIHARKAAWRAANLEKIKAKKALSDAAYRAKNKAKRTAYEAEWRQKNRHKVRAKSTRWKVANPDKLKISRARYRAKNKTRIKASAAIYYLEHKDRILAHGAAYDAAHPERSAVKNARRRARMLAAPINDLTIAQWKAIKEHYGHCCVYCGKQSQRLTQDHVIPLSKGGSHTVQNVVPACRSCNARKNAGPPLKPIQPLLLVS